MSLEKKLLVVGTWFNILLLITLAYNLLQVTKYVLGPMYHQHHLSLLVYWKLLVRAAKVVSCFMSRLKLIISYSHWLTVKLSRVMIERFLDIPNERVCHFVIKTPLCFQTSLSDSVYITIWFLFACCHTLSFSLAMGFPESLCWFTCGLCRLCNCHSESYLSLQSPLNLTGCPKYLTPQKHLFIWGCQAWPPTSLWAVGRGLAWDNGWYWLMRSFS